MPAILKIKPNDVSHPYVGSGALTQALLGSQESLRESTQESFGVIQGGFFFNFVRYVDSRWQMKARKRSTEKGVLVHDHVDDLGGVVTIEANLYGRAGQRDKLYHALKRIQYEIRKNTGSFAMSDPFDVFPFVIVEDLDVRTDREIRYAEGGKAWYRCRLSIRPTLIAGSEEGGDSSAPTARGIETKEEQPSLPPEAKQIPQ